jgi:hypothetical protein
MNQVDAEFRYDDIRYKQCIYKIKYYIGGHKNG